MLPNQFLVEISRVQFGFTAMFHFLFVPLTLGLTWLLVIMEGAYVITGKQVYKDMTVFWGKLFAINFAMGVITGLTMEFEFGTNWAYFSRIIGGSFGPILAIEGITAFMLEATMFGLFFFGWDKLGKKTHWLVTFLMAAGASLSIVNILAANSWMQHPEATFMDPHKMSLSITSIAQLYLNFLAQVRIGHVAYAGFLTASMFVLGISSYYILKGRHIAFAKRSMSVAIGFGLISVIMVGFFGDQNGLSVARHEPEKMAAIEGQWHTQKPPASWYIFAIPHQAAEKNTATLSIPYMLSIIATHSLTGTVEGLIPIMQGYQKRFKEGLIAYAALKKIRGGRDTPRQEAIFKKYSHNIGFALLEKIYAKDPLKATPAQLKQATRKAIPNVATAFFTFRIMLVMWGLMVLILFVALYLIFRNTITRHRWFLRAALFAIPLPYIAAEAGWVLAETGRQPWTVHYYLPTFFSVSSITDSMAMWTLIAFVVFYFSLISIELFLMFKYARLGPGNNIH
ncbi:MAG: cytochrome ubiquinol oxidase subunit I [Gammaproteobacteria bacterium]|nr:cytochrome ubiquinol oxidase subunit I [Gammaproteobacteria bacterium]